MGVFLTLLSQTDLQLNQKTTNKDKPKRDQRAFDLIQQFLPALMLDTIIKMVKELPEPYAVRAGLGGLAAYPPRTMAIICILLEAERTTYRKMAAKLVANHELAKKLNLANRTPTKNTIWRAGCNIPESYIGLMHLYITKDLNLGGRPGRRCNRIFNQHVCQMD